MNEGFKEKEYFGEPSIVITLLAWSFILIPISMMIFIIFKVEDINKHTEILAKALKVQSYITDILTDELIELKKKTQDQLSGHQ